MKIKFINKTFIIIIIILSLFTISTIAYSAIASTMNITGTAKARIKVDTRITNFKIYNTNNATSSYEEFTKNKILFNVSLPNESSTITYEIELTNYGANNAGLYSIDNLPNNLSYELQDYTLKDKICDEEKCTLGAKKTLYLIIKYNTYNQENTSFELSLDFNFQPFYKITFTSLEVESSPSEIIGTDTLNATINQYTKYIDIKMGESYLGLNDYTYTNGVLTIPNVNGDLVISLSKIVGNYENTGSYQIFTAPTDGIYKIELWGASGGDSWKQNDINYRGGYGGYTSGEIKLLSGEKLYVYVGGVGTTCTCHNVVECCGENGGYNGGGKTLQWTKGTVTWYGSGGGATDVRYFTTPPTEEDLLWNSFIGLNSRIMVAGGGGGASNYQADAIHGYNTLGGSAGGLESSVGPILRTDRTHTCTAATQTTAGTGTYNEFSDFGIGGTPTGLYGPGGGGGYFGGGATETINSGGSSYISGHLGCVSLQNSSTREMKTNCETGNESIDCATHYSGKIFTNTNIIDGLSYNWTNIINNQINMPNPIKGTYEMGRGHKGDGYARITFIDDTNDEDLSGNNNVPTFNNITISDEGAVFNGSSSTIEFPTSHGVTFPATYSITFKFNSTAQQVLFGDVVTKAGLGFLNGFKESIVNIGDSTSFTQKFVMPTLKENVKYTIDMVYESSVVDVRLFLDGVEITNRTAENYWIWDSPKSFIGKRADSKNLASHFNGTIERFMIYDDALTIEEINNNLNATSSSEIIKDNLKVFYNFK